jgi:phosphoribosylanthranilate isomerase
MNKIKCCGMTNLEDCRAAEDLGVDFIGFVFYRKSTRFVAPATVRRIIGMLKGEVSCVGVFVDEDDREIAEILRYCGLDFAQVYRPSLLPALIRAFRIDSSVIKGSMTDPIPDAGLCLFDSYSEGFGGSGQAFDLSFLPDDPGLLDRAFIAGGIDEKNVRDVLRLKPFGIDLVSSLEAYPGKKDLRAMERFVKTVRSFAL